MYVEMNEILHNGFLRLKVTPKSRHIQKKDTKICYINKKVLPLYAISFQHIDG